MSAARSSSLLLSFWFLACFALLVTTHEGVEQKEDLGVVSESQDSDARTPGAWGRTQEAMPQHRGHSGFETSARRRLSQRIQGVPAWDARKEGMAARSVGFIGTGIYFICSLVLVLQILSCQLSSRC